MLPSPPLNSLITAHSNSTHTQGNVMNNRFHEPYTPSTKQETQRSKMRAGGGNTMFSKEKNQTKHIVLAADFRYVEQVNTLLKSICCHNRHIQFHLLNNDYPKEWFECINQKLSRFHCHIHNVNITDHNKLQTFGSYEHISSASTYYRYFIEHLDAEYLLYLDCDLVVTGDISPLFSLNLHNDYVAAISDEIAVHFHNRPSFNAGVLVINNALWKQDSICAKALRYTEDNQGKLPDYDQTVLNVLFHDRWLPLNRNWNYQVGMDYCSDSYDWDTILHGQQIPTIIHYNTSEKPWKKDAYPTRFRSVYWQYNQMDWQDIPL